jgi:tyrosine-protein kinase Etk/Wzc
MAEFLPPQRLLPGSPGSPGSPGYPPVVPHAEPGVGAPKTLVQIALDTLALLRRHVLVVLLVTLATLGAAAYKVYNASPNYRATATVRLVNERQRLSGSLGGEAVEPVGGWDTDSRLSQIQVLQSQAVARAVAEKEGLRLEVITRGLAEGLLRGVSVPAEAPRDTITLTFDDSQVTAHGSRGAVRAAYGSPLEVDGVRFAVSSRPTVERAELQVIPLGAAAGRVMGGLKGYLRPKTDVVDVSFTAGDPLVAQRVANAAVQAFQEHSIERGQQASRRRRIFIEQQLDKTESLLAGAQNAFNAFRSRERVYSSQERARAQQSDLTAIEIRRQELDAHRRTNLALLDALQQRAPAGAPADRLSALVASPGIAENPVVAQLFAQLGQLEATRDSMTTGPGASTPDNPDVQRVNALIASTQTKVLSAVRGQIASLDARIQALDDLKARSSAEMATLPRTEAEEANLGERVEIYRRRAEQLREELQKAQIEEAAEAGEVEILDLAAGPGAPIGTGRTAKLAFGLLLGLLLGGGAAYVLENVNTSIRRRDELETLLQIPNLALIPKLALGMDRRGKVLPAGQPNGNGKAATHRVKPELVTIADLRSVGAEAYRTLRTNILFSGSVQSVRTILVTSASPKEGKTTTSANLAITFAQQGYRVLLVDCDLRRARIHRVFRLPQEPGLTQVVLGQNTADEAVRGTLVDGLYVLPTGALPPNPAELLGSPAMRSTLEQLSGMFDLLVLDTPPLLVASDAAILSRVADGTLLVVRAGQTERTAARQAMAQLLTVQARILGAVLNDPDATVPKYGDYYYGTYQYDYSYAPKGD